MRVKGFREAIFDGKLETIRHLAEKRPRLLHQSIDADGNTALGLAILLSDVDTVKELLDLGADPNLANGFDHNHPLVILAKIRQEEGDPRQQLADILLEAGSDPNCIVRYQADNLNRLDATQTPSFCETPFLCAVRYSNEIFVKKLCAKGADIELANEETGMTALMLASSMGYNNIVNILLDAGADPNQVDYQGNAALHHATSGYGENIECIKTLISRGANINISNEIGFTPLMLAKENWNDAVVKLLTSNSSSEPQSNSLPPPPVYDKIDPINDEKMISFI
ncbi:unnamed protein product [Didymodactylos carnosus]|uniref:Ankyrin repeat domain-containing protein n=1 Tax=Didymodactylos carnosus TaxID=1234261 RepID=A0A814E8C7_9BILA|nr:unnamed protein product [Didymodactylos carnosus]CAF0965319.1 unnamed protein product [Didymodactylos carnosus]CAF3565749.1 unnamed protein product [Didymodactylos carnosus]CAF3738902.1 unnamed protein product [Didymodactylos carnosus]